MKAPEPAKGTGTGSRQLDAGGLPPTPPPAKPAPAAPAPKASTPKAPASSSSSTTVKKGDTLTALAQKLLGDGKRWRELYEANKDLIGKNPNLIKPGQKLKLPGDAKTPADAKAGTTTTSTPAASSSDWAAQQKAVTAETRQKRTAIYDQFKGQLDALKTDKSPGHSEKRTQLIAQRSQQLKRLRDDTAAKRKAIRDKRAASKKTTGRTSAMDDITALTPPADAEVAAPDAAMPQPGQAVTLDDGSTGTVAMVGDDHGDPVVVLDDGRVVHPDEIAESAEAPAATTASAHACSCGSRTAAPLVDPADAIDSGMPAPESGAADMTAGLQAILARLDGIDAKLDSIDGNAAMAALPAEAARLASIDEELADMDAQVASLVITVEDAPAFRHGDIVSLPDGSTGWVTYGEPTMALGGELMVRVCTDIGARDDCAENTVLVGVSQIQPTGQVREREWVDDDASIVITSTPPAAPTPAPAPEPALAGA